MGPPKKLILSILPLGIAGTAAVPIFLPMISTFFTLLSTLPIPLTFIPSHGIVNVITLPGCGTLFTGVVSALQFITRGWNYIDVNGNKKPSFEVYKNLQ